MTNFLDRPLREVLADLEHQRWAKWQAYVHNRGSRNLDGSITIPSELVSRWDRQIDTSYMELSEKEKDMDRKEVDKTLKVLEEWGISRNKGI